MTHSEARAYALLDMAGSLKLEPPPYERVGDLQEMRGGNMQLSLTTHDRIELVNGVHHCEGKERWGEGDVWVVGRTEERARYLSVGVHMLSDQNVPNSDRPIHSANAETHATRSLAACFSLER